MIKAYAEHFQKQDLTTRDMQSKMAEMQGKFEREMALVTEMRLRESLLVEQNSNQQQQIVRLQKVAESVQEHKKTENNVSQTIAGMVEASSTWCENSSVLGNKIKELNELLQQRYGLLCHNL
jgi:predicted unusual protein kinase regulating ubiquinone biosynthesis (AarF/ABC1/UbiB family)